MNEGWRPRPRDEIALLRAIEALDDYGSGPICIAVGFSSPPRSITVESEAAFAVS